MDRVSTRRPAASTRRALSFQAKSSWKANVSSVTEVSGESREGMERSRS